MVFDPLDMEDHRVGKFLHILVVCPADNRVMEEVVLRDRIGAVITAAGIHKGGVNPLQLLQFPVREAAAGQLRRQSLQLRQRPVAFFNIRRVNIRHHRSPARHHIDELLSLQDLNASRTGVRLTLNRFASSESTIFSPGFSTPVMIQLHTT